MSAAAIDEDASVPVALRSPATRAQLLVLLICTLLAMIEGIDGQIVSLAAPRMAADFGVAAAAFGPVFASGMVGSLVGVFVQDIIGDRIGHRTVVLLAFAMIGVASLLIPLERNLLALASLRFLIGIGIGAAMPNLFSITSEYAPFARRFLFVTIVFTGIALGAILGGVASAAILAASRWPLLFVLSGVITLASCVAARVLLPESLSFLTTRPTRRGELERNLRRIGSPADTGVPGTSSSPPVRQSTWSVRLLFGDGLAKGTLYLWLICFFSLLVSIALAAWLPTILTNAGLTISDAVLVTTALNGGGMVGSLALSTLVDRQGYRPMILAYLIGAAALAAIAILPFSGTVLALIIFLHGVSFIGAQMCLASLATYYYPPALRSTGVGWAMGMGRTGGIAGTLVGGVLLAHGLSPASAFLGCSALVAVLAILLAFADRSRRGASREPDRERP